MNTLKKAIILISFASSLFLFALGVNAQFLEQSVNPENTGYIKGDLKLPLYYSYDRTIKFSDPNSTGRIGMGMPGGGVGMPGGGAGMGGVMGRGNAVNTTNITTAKTLVTDKVILVTSSTKIYAYEKSKGKLLWSYPSDKDIENNIGSYPVVYNGNIYFVNFDNLFCISETTGKVVWVRKIPDTTSSMIIVNDDILFMQCGDGQIYRVDPKTGNDKAAPIKLDKVMMNNGFAINDRFLITKTNTNAVYGYSFAEDKFIFAKNIEGSVRGYLPILVNDSRVIFSSEKEVSMYSLETGNEINRQPFATPISCQPVSDGKNLYVSCVNQKIYSLDITKNKVEQNWKKPVELGISVDQLTVLQDNALMALSQSGFVFALDNTSGRVVWSSQSGRAQNYSNLNIPGFVNASGSARRNPMGGGMGAGIGMGIGPAMMPQSTANPIVKLSADGKYEEVDLKQITDNYLKAFTPSIIIGKASYNNGILAYVTGDSNLVVRKDVDVSDNKAPEVLNYSPGFDTASRKVSAMPPIFLKISVIDKGSGVDYSSAKLICTDSSKASYDVKLIFDINNQTFYGALSKPKSTVVTPFPNGTFDCIFYLKDYAGNECKFNFNFEIDSSLEIMKPLPDTSLEYLDVSTGDVSGKKINDLPKTPSEPASSSGGGVMANSKPSSNGSSSGVPVKSTNNMEDGKAVINDPGGSNPVPDNTPEGLSLDYVEIGVGEIDITPDPNLPFEGFPPDPPF